MITYNRTYTDQDIHYLILHCDLSNAFLRAFARELIARKCENLLSRLSFINKILNQSPADTNSLLSWSPPRDLNHTKFSIFSLIPWTKSSENPWCYHWTELLLPWIGKSLKIHRQRHRLMIRASFLVTNENDQSCEKDRSVSKETFSRNSRLL